MESIHGMKTNIAMVLLTVIAACAVVFAWNKKGMKAVEAHSSLGIVAPPAESAIAITQVKVASPINGTIREIRVEEGEKLQRGQLIAILENSDSTARVARAEAELEQREARLNQMSGAPATAELQKAKADLQEARTEMEQRPRQPS